MLYLILFSAVAAEVPNVAVSGGNVAVHAPNVAQFIPAQINHPKTNVGVQSLGTSSGGGAYNPQVPNVAGYGGHGNVGTTNGGSSAGNVAGYGGNVNMGTTNGGSSAGNVAGYGGNGNVGTTNGGSPAGNVAAQTGTTATTGGKGTPDLTGAKVYTGSFGPIKAVGEWEIDKCTTDADCDHCDQSGCHCKDGTCRFNWKAPECIDSAECSTKFPECNQSGTDVCSCVLSKCIRPKTASPENVKSSTVPPPTPPTPPPPTPPQGKTPYGRRHRRRHRRRRF